MRRLSVPLVLLLTAFAPSGPRPITSADIYQFKWIADPRISPDGNEAAYTLVQVADKHDKYETSLWVVATDGKSAPRRLTSGPRDAAPRWSPDGKTIAFVRSVTDTGAAQIYLLSLTGGEPRKLTDLTKGAGSPVWSPDGRTIAFGSSQLASDTAPPDKDKSDVHVITRAVYRDNDRGWLDPTRHGHIWTVDVDLGADAPAKAHEVTSGNFDEDDVQWSRDGSQLLFTSDRVEESYYDNPDDDAFAVSKTGGAMAKTIDIDGPVRNVAVSPDGKTYAFAGWVNPAKRQSYTQSAVFVTTDGKTVTKLTSGEAEVGSGVGGDNHPPRGGGGNPLLWSPDGKSLYTAMTLHGRSNIMRIDVATKAVEPVTTGAHDIVAYSATPHVSRFALTISDGTHLSDLYSLDPTAKTLVQLTHVNDELFNQLTLSTPERITYKSFDGTPIEAWVVKPPDFSPSKKYPLILNIHGGPHSAYGETFFHEFQVMAARGYVVLAPNPRGSTTYGESFGNIIQYHYPGDDYKDLMVGVDTLLKRGYIDEKRLGVTGGSGGGLLTNWTITQTHRFAAAVSQRSIADWAAWWYTADFTLFTPSWFRKAPFEDPQEYAQRSPITYIANVTTPLMLVEGESDSRTPSGSGGYTMFRALKAMHKTAVMVVFPGETHELSRSGKPVHRVARLDHIINWFDKYLENKQVAQYDLQ
ncbi:MAG TPA: S9 family peptidase [Gemmatimonadaceae bacterium]|nr:S9 family peptidase [Gemmatimonadaceae bacterium]